MNDHISTVEIEQDIEDTEREIEQMEREAEGLRLIGDKLSLYRATARVDGKVFGLCDYYHHW